jgi:hypothetical protein
LWLSLLWAALAAGCVTRSTHLALQKQLEDRIAGMQKQLHARNQELAAHRASCESFRRDAEGELARVREALDKAQRSLALCEDTLRGKPGKLTELREALQKKEAELQKRLTEIDERERVLHASTLQTCRSRCRCYCGSLWGNRCMSPPTLECRGSAQ